MVGLLPLTNFLVKRHCSCIAFMSRVHEISIMKEQEIKNETQAQTTSETRPTEARITKRDICTTLVTPIGAPLCIGNLSKPHDIKLMSVPTGNYKFHDQPQMIRDVDSFIQLSSWNEPLEECSGVTWLEILATFDSPGFNTPSCKRSLEKQTASQLVNLDQVRFRRWRASCKNWTQEADRIS